jgi:electron transfer flavoprotein beta subunit
LQENETIIRKALALGGDEAFRIDTDGTDAYAIAFQIASMAKDKGYDMILTGKETIDHNNGSTGAMIAAMLDINCIGLATKLELENNLAVVSREVDGGVEILESPFPLLISCQKGMAEPRIPTMRGIMAARTKPLNTMKAFTTDVFTETISFSIPAKKAGITMIPTDQPELLVKLLREEAKAI